MPTPLAPGTPGWFAQPNPAAGIAPTTISPDWCNTVQSEIIGVAEMSGLTLSKASANQMAQALTALLAQKLPILNPAASGALIVGGNYGPGAIEVGSYLAAGPTYVDFHSSAPSASGPNDYDTRMISTGGITGTSGQGTLSIIAGAITLEAPVNAEAITAASLTTTTGLVVTAPPAATPGILLGAQATGISGLIYGNAPTGYTNGLLILQEAGSNRLVCDASGNLTLSGTGTFGGTLTAASISTSGNASVGGTVSAGAVVATTLHSNTTLFVASGGSFGGSVTAPDLSVTTLEVSGATTAAAITASGRITGTADMVVTGEAYLNGGFTTPGLGFVDTAPAATDAGTGIPNTAWVQQAIVHGNGLTFSRANPGYQVFPCGAIRQTGTSSSGPEGSTSITFPIPFPNACDGVKLNESNASGSWAGNGSSGTPTVHGIANGWTKTGFGVYSMQFTNGTFGGVNGLGFTWEAWGY